MYKNTVNRLFLVRSYLLTKHEEATHGGGGLSSTLDEQHIHTQKKLGVHAVTLMQK